MSNTASPCPQCGAALALRLGQLECPTCGYSAPATPSAEPTARASAPSHDPGAAYRQQATPPPPPGPYFTGRSATPLDAGGDPLAREKRAYMIMAFMSLAMTIGNAMALSTPTGLMIQSINTPANEHMRFTPASAAGMAVGGLIGFGLQALTLYLHETWLKWTCLGCTGVATLANLALLAGLINVWAGPMGHQPQEYLQVACALWLITLLWRDIQAHSAA